MPVDDQVRTTDTITMLDEQQLDEQQTDRESLDFSGCFAAL